MSSGYFSQFSQKKKSATGPRPAAGPGSGPSNYAGYGEGGPKWPGAPGPKGPKRNSVNFPEVKQAAAQDMADDKGSRVSKKISKLRHEGEPEKKAVAMAINMEREGRLTASGGYKRKK